MYYSPLYLWQLLVIMIYLVYLNARKTPSISQDLNRKLWDISCETERLV